MPNEYSVGVSLYCTYTAPVDGFYIRRDGCSSRESKMIVFYKDLCVYAICECVYLYTPATLWDASNQMAQNEIAQITRQNVYLKQRNNKRQKKWIDNGFRWDSTLVAHSENTKPPFSWAMFCHFVLFICIQTYINNTICILSRFLLFPSPNACIHTSKVEFPSSYRRDGFLVWMCKWQEWEAFMCEISISNIIYYNSKQSRCLYDLVL